MLLRQPSALALAACLLLSATCDASGGTAILPIPSSLTPREGFFECRTDTVILTDAESRKTAELLSWYLREPTGYDFPLEKGSEARDNAIQLRIDRSLDRLGQDGYRLEAGPHRVIIRSSTAAGLFYGVQSFRQLLPPEIFAAARVDGVAWKAPAVMIEDMPRFRWRGAMVDVARHFMPKADLYRFIDAMAAIKLNRLQLHLTDTQGWRMEIHKYPQLTSQRGPTTKEQFQKKCNCGLENGYYTQADLRQIVAYARERHILVVPEIEIPGHAGAAVAAMPEMGNTDAWMPPEDNGSSYRYRVFSPAEKTILFLQDILSEVLDVFPSPVIHLGGDEVRRDEWRNSPSAQKRMQELGLKDEDEIQSYITRRMNQFLTSRGRRMSGWGEIVEGGRLDGAIVTGRFGSDAVRKGYDVVIAESEYTYFDYYQSRDPREPIAHHYYLPLRRVYGFDPLPPGIKPSEAEHVLGAQGQLWTTYMPTPNYMEYMAFPRLAALAEVVWSPSGKRDYGEFKARLIVQQQRWSAMGVNFRPLNATTDDNDGETK